MTKLNDFLCVVYEERLFRVDLTWCHLPRSMLDNSCVTDYLKKHLGIRLGVLTTLKAMRRVTSALCGSLSNRLRK